MNIVRYAVMALAVSFASVAFGRVKLISTSGEMSFTEGSYGYFNIQLDKYRSESYFFIYPLDSFSSYVSSSNKRVLADDCVGSDSEVVFEGIRSERFILFFGDGSIDYGFFNYWIIRSTTPRWDVFTNGYSSVSDACTTTNKYLIEVDKLNDPLEIINVPPVIGLFTGIGSEPIEQYSEVTCEVEIDDKWDPIICKWEIAGSNYVQEIYQYGEQGQYEFVQPIVFDKLGPHRLTVYAKDKDMSGWVHELVKEFTVVEPSMDTASLVSSGHNRIENGKLYVPEYIINYNGLSEILLIDTLDHLKVKIPKPLTKDTTYIISIGDTFDGDLNLLSKADYDRGTLTNTTKSLKVLIKSGSTESEEVYLIDADGTKETARGIRISVIEESSTIGPGYFDVCVTNCPPFLYMNNKFISYTPSQGGSAQVGTDARSTSKWFVYDSYRDLVPRNGHSKREFIVTNKIIAISGNMAASLISHYDDMTNGVLQFQWTPSPYTVTTWQYFQSIDKDGGEGKSEFILNLNNNGMSQFW